MKKSLFISLTLLLLTFNASALHAAVTEIYDWGSDLRICHLSSIPRVSTLLLVWGRSALP
jgi:hypothetical protein